MQLVSTRNQNETTEALDAVLRGIAPAHFRYFRISAAYCRYAMMGSARAYCRCFLTA
jgi:threonine synthase